MRFVHHSAHCACVTITHTIPPTTPQKPPTSLLPLPHSRPPFPLSSQLSYFFFFSKQDFTNDGAETINKELEEHQQALIGEVETLRLQLIQLDHSVGVERDRVEVLDLQLKKEVWQSGKECEMLKTEESRRKEERGAGGDATKTCLFRDLCCCLHWSSLKKNKGKASTCKMRPTNYLLSWHPRKTNAYHKQWT